MITPIQKAREAVGGASALARLLGNVTPQAVTQWRDIPALRVIDIERVTGIPRDELRPDLYPPSLPPPPAPAGPDPVPRDGSEVAGATSSPMDPDAGEAGTCDS